MKPVIITILGEPETTKATQFRQVFSKKAGKTITIAYKPANVVRWQIQCRRLAQEQMIDRQPFDEPLKLTLRVYLPIPQWMSNKRRDLALKGVLRPATKPDLDNVTGRIVDALQGVVFVNDSRIVHLDVAKFYTEKPCVLVKVEPLGENNDGIGNLPVQQLPLQI